MAKEKLAPEPEVVVEVQLEPQLSDRTREEMEFGRKQALANAQALAAAEKARTEEKG